MLHVQCPIAQINGGKAQPNWYKREYKRAKQENRQADYRWGADQVTHADVDGQVEGSRVPMKSPQPQCAAAAMMHGLARPPISSYQGGCPTIAEHQELKPPMQPSHATGSDSPESRLQDSSESMGS